MTFYDFIRLKTPQRLASSLAVSESTIYSWATRNDIPRERWPDIMVTFPEVGLRDLLEMEGVSA